MSAALFWGSMIAAFGIAMVVFLRVIVGKAQLMLVMISGAFFWLMAIMLSSIVWHIILPLKGEYFFYIPVTIFIQEGFRFAFFRAYAASERAFAAMGTNAASFPMSDVSCSAAAGLGFGITQTMMEYASTLRYSSGPGTLFNPKCSELSVFVSSAWLACLFNLLNVFWMMIAFDAYRRASVPRTAIVVGLHLLASFATLLAQIKGACVGALIAVVVITGISGAICWVIMHQPGYRSRRALAHDE